MRAEALDQIQWGAQRRDVPGGPSASAPDPAKLQRHVVQGFAQALNLAVLAAKPGVVVLMSEDMPSGR